VTAARPEPTSPWVTHSELDDALDAVREDIAETEHRLRGEFTSAVRYEIDRVHVHLEKQDESLKWIQRTLLTALIGAALSVLAGLSVYLITH
jgi:hypothetical protein